MPVGDSQQCGSRSSAAMNRRRFSPCCAAGSEQSAVRVHWAALRRAKHHHHHGSSKRAIEFPRNSAHSPLSRAVTSWAVTWNRFEFRGTSCSLGGTTFRYPLSPAPGGTRSPSALIEAIRGKSADILDGNAKKRLLPLLCWARSLSVIGQLSKRFKQTDGARSSRHLRAIYLSVNRRRVRGARGSMGAK